jgi:hypothetical protein
MQKNLRDFFNADLENVFFNTDEFAETLLINDRSVTVIRDPERLNRAQKEGLEAAELLFAISKKDLKRRPVNGEKMTVGERDFRVLNISNEDGMYVITLERYQ